jgi:hypothetical protein
MMEVIKWAAAECERQHSGEMSVAWMVAGYEYAVGMSAPWRRDDFPSVKTIQILASKVEPRTNKLSAERPDNFRKVDVIVGDRLAVTPSWQEVPRIMDALIDAWNDLSADDWYRAFQEIHPFADGNGRVGAILWNAHRGTLDADKLEVPPDFWNHDRLETA